MLNRTFELKAIEGYRCIFATFPTPLHTPLPIGWNLIRGSMGFQEQSYDVLICVISILRKLDVTLKRSDECKRRILIILENIWKASGTT